MAIVLFQNILKNRDNFAVFNKIFIIIVCLFSCSVMADDNCLRFRYDVDVNIKNNTDNNVVVEKSAENLVGRLGYTVSNITDRKSVV